MSNSHARAPFVFNEHPGGTTVTYISPYAGLPVSAVELLSKYHVYDLMARLDTDTIPGAAEAPGDSWTVTATGASTLTVSDDLTPPRLIATPAAADNDSVEAQLTAATGVGEDFNLASGKKRYFECQFVLTDANDDAATVQQAEIFLGFAITSATVLDGNTDFIGFNKADGTGLVSFVAGKNAGAAGALIDDIPQSRGVTIATADAGVAGTLHKFAFLAIGTNTVAVYGISTEFERRAF